MKKLNKLVLSTLVAGMLASSASAWDFCSTESQIGIAAGSMGTGIAVASATAGGVPGLIVGAILNQWLCDPVVSTETTEEPKTLVQTELKTNPLVGIESIYFDFDSVILDEEAKAEIKDNTTVINLGDKITSIRIEGNADSRGSDEYNYALGLKRAEAVKARLISEGVTNPLEVVSYGEANPACTEITEDCFSKNRRVQFKTAE